MKKNKCTYWLSLLVAMTISACATKETDYQQMSVDDIIEKVQYKKDTRFWAETEFSVKATVNGVGGKRGYWFLMSDEQYQNHSHLVISIRPQLVRQLKQQYQVETVAQLNGKQVKVKGMVEYEVICKVQKGCAITGAKGDRPLANSLAIIRAETLEHLTII